MNEKEVVAKFQKIIDTKMTEFQDVDISAKSSEEAIKKAMIHDEKFTIELVRQVLIEFFTDHQE